jgi:hypothetical protein
MESTKHLITGILMALCIVIFGTAGYMGIEGWEFFDALYMTIITISTVGYSEVHQVSKAGRLFTIVLVFLEWVSLCILLLPWYNSWLKEESESYWGEEDWKRKLAG